MWRKLLMEGRRYEVIATTSCIDGRPNAAAVGVTRADESLSMRVFSGTDTFDNVHVGGRFGLNLVEWSDVTFSSLLPLTEFPFKECVAALGISGGELTTLAGVLFRLARGFIEHDLTLAEINPLARLEDGTYVALDCHIEMEDEAVGRQRALLEALGAEVEELEDWTCCGASAAMVMSDLLGVVLPARNLALAEQVGNGREVLAICSACYTNFRRTSEAIAADPALLTTVNQALEVEGLIYHGTVTARHLMDVLANDFSLEEIAARVQRPLEGLTVAPYYGCQTVRPYSPFDNDQRPTSMVAILEALGATVHRHNREASCCGTSLLMTKPKVGVEMAGMILEACGPADCAAVVCPMCHMNLDSYQDQASRAIGRALRIPVLFLPQLIGLAFGLPESALMLKRHVVSVKPVLERLTEAEAV